MFPTGLIHAGAKGSSGGLALVTNMGLAASYSCSETEQGPVTTKIRFTVKRNGQWIVEQIIGSNGITGSPVSGNWGSPNQAFAGDDYEVLIAVNSGAGGTFTNQASSYIRLTADKFMELEVTDSNVGAVGETANRNITATVRKFGTTSPISTDTADFSVTAHFAP